MIYGIMAAESETTYLSPPPSPPMFFAFADFINGSYTFNGPSTLANFITDLTPTRITANGLHAINGSPLIPIAGDFKDTLSAANWTIVLEVDLPVFAGEHVFFNLWTEPGGEIVEIYCQTGYGAWGVGDNNDNYDPYFRWAQDNVNSTTSGVHKLAFTRTNDRVSLSVDGNAVQTDTSNTYPIDLGSPVNVWIGGWNGGSGSLEFYLRSIAIYEPVSDADLPDLSV